MGSLRWVLPLSFCLLVLGTTTTAILYDNLNAATASADSVSDDGPLYDSFTSGTTILYLTDVMLSLANAAPQSAMAQQSLSASKALSPARSHHPKRARGLRARAATPKTTSSGPFITVALYADSAGSPGSLLTTIGTLNDTSLSASPSSFDFPLGTPALLAANTRYWIGISTTNGSAAFWDWSLDIGGTGVSTGFFANDGGVSPNVDGPYQMRVTALSGAPTTTPTPSPTPTPSSTPAPPTAVLMLIGAICIGLYVTGRKYIRSN